jgi:hypothetical protein
MKMKKNLQKKHAQKIKRRLHGKNAFCWIFVCVNDNKMLIMNNNSQMMYCIIYYISPINAFNFRT